MDAAQELIVHGDKIISSPGSISIAPTAHIRPEVHELTLIACLTLNFSLQAYSNSFTLGPPLNFSPHDPRKSESIPEFTTSITAFFSSSPIVLYFLNV